MYIYIYRPSLYNMCKHLENSLEEFNILNRRGLINDNINNRKRSFKMMALCLQAGQVQVQVHLGHANLKRILCSQNMYW